MKKRCVLLVGSLSALVVGALDYGFFRQDTYVGKIVGRLLHIREMRDCFCYGLLAWYLPDYLWMLALALAFFAVTAPRRRHLWMWAVGLTLYGGGWELTQYFGIVSGTADRLDSLLYMMAVCTAVMINLLLTRREQQ